MVDYSKYQGPPPDISYTIDIGLPYGKMPDEALVSKFEYTNEGDNIEYMYDEFSRETLKDRRPDTATFEYEEPRKSISNKGYLNTLHYGGRGEYNYPAHPEINTEITDREPRRTFTDPDYRELRMQEDARMRFVNFYPGNDDNSISSGSWRENQVRDAKKHMFNLLKPRMRIFSTSEDGRREGMRRSYEYKSNIDKVQYDKTYGDTILDWSLNPQRKTIVLSNELIRNTRWYHRHTPDHEFTVAKYGENPRKMKLNISENKTQMYEGDIGKYSEDVTCEDLTVAYKNIGILMGTLVSQKYKIKEDIDKKESTDAQIRKLSEMRSNIEKILFETVHDTEYYNSDETQSRKTSKPVKETHKSIINVRDNLKPANYYHEAMLMYKSLDPSNDVVSIKFKAIDDENKVDMRGEEYQARKTCRENMHSGMKDTVIEVDDKTLSIKSYKSSKTNPNEKKKNMLNPELFGNNSDNTQDRKVSHTNYRITNTKDISQNLEFPDNDMIDHYGGRIGKYGSKLKVRRYADSENNSTLVSENSA